MSRQEHSMFEHLGPEVPQGARRNRFLLSALVFVVLLSAYLLYLFRNYPEERQALHFFQALQREDYQEAYRIWQPTDTYTFRDFLEDWGPNGLSGPIRDFRVTRSYRRGTGVIVRVRFNRRRGIALWVEKKDKSLSFPP